jgi:hypothetical protein
LQSESTYYKNLQFDEINIGLQILIMEGR